MTLQQAKSNMNTLALDALAQTLMARSDLDLEDILITQWIQLLAACPTPRKGSSHREPEVQAHNTQEKAENLPQKIQMVTRLRKI